MNDPPAERVVCARCGRHPGPWLYLCPCCLDPAYLVESHPRGRVPWRFDLITIVWLVGAFAVGLGLLRPAPGVAVPWLVIVPATIVRSSPILYHRRKHGRRGGALRATDVVLESLLMVTFIVIAASIAFFATCIPVGFAAMSLYSGALSKINVVFLIGSAAGLLASIAVFATVGRRYFPPQD